MNRSIKARFLTAAFALLTAVTTSADSLGDWMSRVPDATYVSQLSLPGAHDAGTGYGLNNVYGVISGERYGRTQDKTIPELWECGFRVFDLRPCVDGNNLRINHGIISTKLLFADAITTLCDLLDSHPTEMAVVIMRHEMEGDDNSNQWNALVTATLNDNNVKPHTATYRPLATMGDMRGKLLILSRDEYASQPIGGFVSGWNFNADFANQQNGKIKGVSAQGSLYVQDFYDCSANGASLTKTAAVERMLTFSTAENTNPNLWVINHTSGYSKTESIFGNVVSTSDGYRDNAATQNTAAIDYIAHHGGSTGMMLMDFGAIDSSNGYAVNGKALAEAIVTSNFKDGPLTPYYRALTTMATNVKQRIFTVVDGEYYYLTTEGYLTPDILQAGTFTFRRMTGGHYYFGYNLLQAYFTNPPVSGNPTLETGHIERNTEQHRKDWEAQVFMLNSEGLYAVRATNAAGGTEGWGVNADTYWTVGTNGETPVAQYAKEPHYVWQLEEATAVDAIDEVTIETSNSSTSSMTPITPYIYDLSGQRVSAATPMQQLPRGIYIVGKRKIVNK